MCLDTKRIIVTYVTGTVTKTSIIPVKSPVKTYIKEIEIEDSTSIESMYDCRDCGSWYPYLTGKYDVCQSCK